MSSGMLVLRHVDHVASTVPDLDNLSHSLWSTFGLRSCPVLSAVREVAALGSRGPGEGAGGRFGPTFAAGCSQRPADGRHRRARALATAELWSSRRARSQ